MKWVKSFTHLQMLLHEGKVQLGFLLIQFRVADQSFMKFLESILDVRPGRSVPLRGTNWARGNSVCILFISVDRLTTDGFKLLNC